LEHCDQQLQALRDWFDDLGQTHDRLPAILAANDEDTADAEEACAA
jgi:tRNA-dihydrouridine synthase B